MRNRNIILVFMFITLVFNVICLPVQSVTGEDSAITESERIEALKSNYLLVQDLKTRDQPLRGTGVDDFGKTCAPSLGPSCDVVLLQENLITTTALSLDYDLNRNEESLDWTKNDIYSYISKMKNSTDPVAGYKHSDEIYENYPQRTFAIDQFYFLEFISETYQNANLALMVQNLKEAFNYSLPFRANVSYVLSNDAPYGAYWTAMDYGNKLTNENQNPGRLANPIYNPYENNYDIPMTNLSLWAAASYAHFATVISEYHVGDDSFKSDNQVSTEEYISELKDLGMDYRDIYYNFTDSQISPYELYTIATNLAQEAFSYAELYGWNKSVGLYNHYQSGSSKSFFLETQITAILACARLFDLTGEQSYIQKADIILDSIMEKYWDTGIGGFYSSYTPNVDTQERNERFKSGFDNSLMSYSLIQLAKSQDADAVRFTDFWDFEKPKNNYLEIAEDIIYFMNNMMWLESETGKVKGYVEWLDSSGEIMAVEDYDVTTRYATTNMLAFYTLNFMTFSNEPFAEYYMNFIIYLSISLIGLIIILVILRKGALGGGAEMPSVVRSMMGKGDKK